MEPVGIRLENVRAGYDDQVALDGTSCELALRRTTAIIGPGGSGKSTLLKLIAGPPYSEKLWSTGAIERSCAPLVLIGQRSATVAPSDKPPTCAVEAQQLRALWEGGSPHVLKSLLEAVDGAPELVSFDTYRLLELSVALATPERCVLLDEPTAGLSPDARAAVCALLERVRGSRTIIIVSHDLAFTRTVADDVIFLLDGAIIEAGTARTIFENPTRERTRAMIRWGG